MPMFDDPFAAFTHFRIYFPSQKQYNKIDISRDKSMYIGSV